MLAYTELSTDNPSEVIKGFVFQVTELYSQTLPAPKYEIVTNNLNAAHVGVRGTQFPT